MKGNREYDQFGYAVDMTSKNKQGKIIAIAAGGYDGVDGETDNTGLVRVFKRKKNQGGYVWRQMGKDFVGSATSGGIWSLKLSENGYKIALGSSEWLNDTGYIDCYQWDKTEEEWLPMGQRIEGMFEGDNFGWGMDFSKSGNTLITGIYGYDGANVDDDGNDLGGFEVWKFEENNGTWYDHGGVYYTQGTTGGDESFYGWSVSVDAKGERTAVAGMYDTYNSTWSGGVKVYDIISYKNFTQVGSTLFGGSNGDEFGVSVALSKDGLTIAVGAGCYYYCDYNDENDDHEDLYEDYVQIYRWSNITNDWFPIGHINREEGDVGFGISVSISYDGDRVAVATAGEDYGYARVYQNMGDGEWHKVAQDLVIEDFKDGDNGHIVEMSGDGKNIVVSSKDKNIHTGEVKVYKLVSNVKKFPVAGCEDAGRKIKFLAGDNVVNCKDVTSDTGLCNEPGVPSMCPHACGTCFANACSDGELRFHNGLNCAWVAEEPQERCYKKHAAACRKTCATRMYDTFCHSAELE